MSDAEKLPDYAPLLSSQHEAFAPELSALVASLPLRPGDRVLDLACGDGVYSRLLAERGGRVSALDSSQAFLDLARREPPLDLAAGRIDFVKADLNRLPFPDGCFDLVWCAQSLYSLPDPVDALRRMRRMARPGAVVAVLENDEFHHILLPWPVEIELALRHAELVSYIEQSNTPRKYYVGRRLRQVFHAAGLIECRQRSSTIDREAPLEPKARDFFARYLQDLAERVRLHLEPSTRDSFEALIDRGSASYLLDSADFAAVCINYVVIGVNPGTNSSMVERPRSNATHLRKAVTARTRETSRAKARGSRNSPGDRSGG